MANRHLGIRDAILINQVIIKEEQYNNDGNSNNKFSSLSFTHVTFSSWLSNSEPN